MISNFDDSILNHLSHISLAFDYKFPKFLEPLTDAYWMSKYERIAQAARVFIDEYWKKAQLNGFGVNILDDIIMVIVVFRFLILALRYNLRTSLIITASSTAAAWLWYNNFITLLFLYEHALYKNALTFRLGVDATQIRRAGEGRVASSEFGIRITNPFGILSHAIRYGSKYGDYRIDPISMIVANILDSDFVPQFIKRQLDSFYYLFYRELIPLSVSLTRKTVKFLTGYLTYMGIVRVGKNVCPYIIRWHWTFVYLLSFIQIYFLYVIQRANEYSVLQIYPQIVAAKEFGLYMPRQEFEMKIIYLMCFSFIIAHLCFVLYGMFHALVGQYFYIPFFTENIELHVGPRNKNSIYSGGYTAWQDEAEKPRGIIPKFWYGWFGRGTLKPNFLIRLINYFIFFPIYLLAKKIFNIVKKFVDRIWWYIWWRL